jgi:hypothetical protein
MIKIREEKLIEHTFDDAVINLFADFILDLHKEKNNNDKRRQDNRKPFKSRH